MAEPDYRPVRLATKDGERLEDNAPRAPLKTGGGGGTFDGMDRVAALEKAFEKMDAKLDTIVRDVSYLKGKVDSLPTTLQLLGFVLAVLAIAGLAKYFAP